MRLETLLGIALVLPVAGGFLSEARTPRRTLTSASNEAALQAPVQSSYPETADGLKNLLQDLFSATKVRDKKKISELLQSFAIPNHAVWFLKTFGASEGPGLDSKYAEYQVRSADWLEKEIEQAVKGGSMQIEVTPIEKPEDTEVRLIKAVLGAMSRPTTIYMTSGSKGLGDRSPFYLGEFVYVDGGFRYIARPVFQALSTAPPMRVRVGGNVQHARLLKEVVPQYPEEARTQKISGTVALNVVIGTDGKVQQVQVVSGDPLLAQAAVEAVRQWVYQPTLLNGTPVEVDTAVEVNFHR